MLAGLTRVDEHLVEQAVEVVAVKHPGGSVLLGSISADEILNAE
jgi:hypothetical protein